MVCTTRRSLRRGSELTYNYDAHNSNGAFTVSSEEAVALAHLGLTYEPFSCRHPTECPRQRFISLDNNYNASCTVLQLCPAA
jgi:hypothetical protein